MGDYKEKAVCSRYWKQMADELGLFDNLDHMTMFDCGLIYGQAEKVFNGACAAMMIRPSEDVVNFELEFSLKVAKMFGLECQPIGREIWIARPHILGPLWDMYRDGLKNTKRWHTYRAMICGIPLRNCDDQFHKLYEDEEWMVKEAEEDIDLPHDIGLNSEVDDDGKPRLDVRLFAREMERVLKLNDHKNGWENCDADMLVDMLDEEKAEVVIALADAAHVPSDESRLKLLGECADLANVAMMVADNYGGLNHSVSGDERGEGASGMTAGELDGLADAINKGEV